MKRQLVAGVAALGFTLGLAGSAGAGVQDPGHPHHTPHAHGHLKMIGLEEHPGGMVSYRKCIEYKPVPMQAHHRHKHMGGAHGPNQVVIPMAPFGDLTGCDHLAEEFGPPNTPFLPPGPPPSH